MESSLDGDFADTVFPRGHIEIVFNLSENLWKSTIGTKHQTDPPIELLGQITGPMHIKTTGRFMLLGIRFFAHTPAYFFREEVSIFNNQVSDARDVLGGSVKTLHARLLDIQDITQRIQLIEDFLKEMLSASSKRNYKIDIVSKILHDINVNSFSDNIHDMASKYGISSRYLQKLFVQHIGIAPKLYSRINRFQASLKQINDKGGPLTAIAYDCGYSDQSHFIRDFKYFTGRLPSSYSFDNSSNTSFVK